MPSNAGGRASCPAPVEESPESGQHPGASMRSLRLLTVILVLTACRASETPEAAKEPRRPSILLVTLDTTRADAVGENTPALSALAARGRTFRQAYTAVPQTLPSHASMMTGLYPAGHGIHENARYLDRRHPLAAERLKEAGYATAGFVSAFVLDRRFGLARGFDVYDDRFGADRAERSSKETTDLALTWLERQSAGPVFLWVHYFDPHAPYEPPEPYRSRFAQDPYYGEVAAMDEQLGRLLAAFEKMAGADAAIVVASDHGEGLGDHGESQHGNLLYQPVMHVPLVLAGAGVTPGTVDTPVSLRRVYDTLLDLGGIAAEGTLLRERSEVVLGEAMKPFLQYGWRPQVMAVEGRLKAILAGELETYDVRADPAESRNLGSGAPISRELRAALRDYPLPSLTQPAPEALDEESRRQLASLGYVSSSVRPAVRADAPRPADMTALFGPLEQSSTMFIAGAYRAVIPLLRQILEKDAHNVEAALRLAVAHSMLGQEEQAVEAFERARAIAPESTDVSHYFAMHFLRGREWRRAVPLLESVLAREPGRITTIEALAEARAREGRAEEALELFERAAAAGAPATASERAGELAMNLGRTERALAAFERARTMQGAAFAHDLELGVLYLAARRFGDARAALDRVPSSHPAWPMALFKRAQVSVLLNEPDREERIALARKHADATTRELIASERLFAR